MGVKVNVSATEEGLSKAVNHGGGWGDGHVCLPGCVLHTWGDGWAVLRLHHEQMVALCSLVGGCQQESPFDT